jgi:hypothetical protein
VQRRAGWLKPNQVCGGGEDGSGQWTVDGDWGRKKRADQAGSNRIQPNPTKSNQIQPAVWGDGSGKWRVVGGEGRRRRAIRSTLPIKPNQTKSNLRGGVDGVRIRVCLRSWPLFGPVSDEGSRRRDADGGGRDDRAPQSKPVKPSQTQSNPVKPSQSQSKPVKSSQTQSNPVKLAWGLFMPGRRGDAVESFCKMAEMMQSQSRAFALVE